MRPISVMGKLYVDHDRAKHMRAGALQCVAGWLGFFASCLAW